MLIELEVAGVNRRAIVRALFSTLDAVKASGVELALQQVESLEQARVMVEGVLARADQVRGITTPPNGSAAYGKKREGGM